MPVNRITNKTIVIFQATSIHDKSPKSSKPKKSVSAEATAAVLRHVRRHYAPDVSRRSAVVTRVNSRAVERLIYIRADDALGARPLTYMLRFSVDRGETRILRGGSLLREEMRKVRWWLVEGRKWCGWVVGRYDEKMAMILVVGVIVADWLLRNWLGWKNFKKCRCNKFHEDDSQNGDIR